MQNSKIKKLLALFIALIMMLPLSAPVLVSATAAKTTATTTEEDAAAAAAKAETERITLFLSTVYANPDEKLATFGRETVDVVEGTGKNAKTVKKDMPNGKPDIVKDGFELYYQYDTGEVAVKDTRTGQIMFSNPYDLGLPAAASSDATKQLLLSQIYIKYKEGDKNSDMNSFKDAALNKQISMKKIKGGIRVEYTIGKEQKRKLVPRVIEKSSFDNNILQYITNQRELDKMNAYYTLKDAKDPTLTDRAKKELQVTYPITSTYAIYVFDPNASERELTQIEGYIKQYTKYTFEMMDADHALVGYQDVLKAPPLFKMALEYYIDKEGLYVRLPANGIRYDESTYTMTSMKILPYMGAGRRGNTGYTFVPDGSGALVRYEDIGATPFTLTNRIYGPDYSFYKIGGGNHTRKWRLPVFGNVENYNIVRTIKTDPKEVYYDATGNRVDAAVTSNLAADGTALDTPRTVYYDKTGTEVSAAVKVFVDADGNEYDTAPKPTTEKRWDGFLAIIEEGDVMAEVTTDHGGNTNIYNTVNAQFTPRPIDEYNLDVAAKGINSLITVAARRKYAGNYIIRYIMLSSDENGKPKNPSGGYEATYTGMAKAYRQYLLDRGEMTLMKDDGSDIPLYIESLGTIETSEYFMGIPYPGMTALTSFADIKSIIDELNSQNITNIKFRLNGWINGGIRGTAPVKLKIENSLGGKKGFQDAVNYAKEKGAEIYPDMDYALVWWWKPLDGTNRKKDGARYMDQMFAREQKYSFMTQDFNGPMSAPDELIAPERMDQMYEKVRKQYVNFNVGGVSVRSLGRELHSNHYKKSLVNRQEAETYVTDLLAKMQSDNGKLLSVEANAYAFKYLDSITSVDLDSSRFLNQSEAVPFYAMVTHGCINIAGSSINMEGDYDYQVLKSLENGASPNFVLSYQNSNRLKEAASWSLNSYYSVDYKTWLGDMLATYKKLNDALKPVKTKQIIGHEYIQRNVVQVTYEGGTSFILNYNATEVTVNGHTIAPIDFVKVS